MTYGDFAWRDERDADLRKAVRLAHDLHDDAALVRELCRQNPKSVIAACERLAPRSTT